MCLLAMITPSLKTTSPFGPIKVQPGVFLCFPDSLTGGVIPIFLASVKESSTCVEFLVGPKTDAEMSPLGPFIITFSTQAN